MNKALAIAVANAHLGMQIAALTPGQASPDPGQLTAHEMLGLSPAQRLKEQQRCRQLATQIAKQTLKKS
jgi:hypothetical protein